MEMINVEYGNVFAGSGVMGFFGEGYWFHHLMKPWGFSLEGMTLVSKTVTLFPHKGNMPLTRAYKPRYPFARCIKTNIGTNAMLNAVGLSNPGLAAILATGKLQALKKPFGISVMSIADTPQQRMDEERAMALMLKVRQHEFQAPFFVQINKSCPNTEHDPCAMIKETKGSLEAFASILPDVPRMPKFSIASAPLPAVMELDKDPNCDAICVSNTIPYDWNGFGQTVWGQEKSPLADLGGGGISGAPIKSLVLAWIEKLRAAGFEKPINGGGGIMSVDDIDQYHAKGVDSVFFASAAVVTIAKLHPRRAQELIRYGNQLTWRNLGDYVKKR